MHNFKELKIWKRSMELSKDIFSLTDNFPDKHKFGLVSQMNRCSVSIPSNIAEGTSRVSSKDFGRFLQIALGSAFELETQLIISKDIGCLDIEKANEVILQTKEIQRMINGFRSTLN